jgi:hypothetical protein
MQMIASSNREICGIRRQLFEAAVGPKSCAGDFIPVKLGNGVAGPRQYGTGNSTRRIARVFPASRETQ